MPILESQIDKNSDEFRKNRERMLEAIQEFRDAEAGVQATSDKSRERFRKRKQLMPRERIALLLDRGAPFLELMPLAGYRLHDDKDGSSAGGGSIAGIGYVEGVRCVVSAIELRDQGRHGRALRPAQGPARPADRAWRTSCRS